MESPQEAARRIVETLERGRSSDKEVAVERLKDQDAPELRQMLRRLLIDKLAGYQSGPEQGQPESPERSAIRGWLLSALGSVVDSDPEARERVRKHLDPAFEPDGWARYWALVGLVNSKLEKSDLQDVAQEVLRLEPAPSKEQKGHDFMARSLATVILASLEDKARLKEVQACLEKKDRQAWAMLRALRVRPLRDEAIIQSMRDVVDDVRTRYSDISYDAIFALGKVPPDWKEEAERAAQSLQAVVSRIRPWGSFDAMRQRALLGLGNLGARDSVGTLLTDLTDSNPSIAQAAAISLERVLKTEPAVARILEAASEAKRQQADMSLAIRLYADALRNMDDKKVVERLEAAAVSDVEHQDVARLLLTELGGLQAFQSLRVLTSAVKDYQDALHQAEDAIRLQFDATLREARGGFAIALFMDIVVFLLGIVLLSVSAAYAMGGDIQDTEVWVGVVATGGSGILGVLYGTLVAEPRVQVQQAIDHMMQLKVVFLGYLRQLHQIDQLYTRRMLERAPMTAREVQHFSDTVKATMADAMQHILRIDRKRMAPEEHRRKRSAAKGDGHDRAASGADGHARAAPETSSPHPLGP